MTQLPIQPGGTLMPGAPRPPHHPIAKLFPMLEEDRRASFRASLAEGQNHPIVLKGGAILDGRNRERELVELGKPVSYVVFTGTDRQALDFVLAENLERRHLTESQRAMLAAKLATLRLGDNQHTREAASMPQLPGLAPAGPSAPSEAGHPSPPGQICPGSAEAGICQSDDDGPTPDDAPAVSQAEAADILNVSHRSVKTAAKVQREAIPEVVEAVEKGELAVSAAAEIAALPIEEQKAIIAAADPKAVKEVAKKQRAEKQAAGRARRLENMKKPDATPLLAGGAKVGVFYVDIPREFVAWSDDGLSKSPEMHYRTERFRFLADMREKILARAKDDSIMIMWAWANSLQDQLDLLAEWGFASVRRRDEAGRLLRDEAGEILPPAGEGRYRTHQVWVKRSANGNLHRGTGFWFIDCHEVMLVGARGDVPAPLMGTQAMSVIESIIGAHSEKPNEIVRDQIDAYFPGVRKLELFGRVPDPAAFKARHPDWEVLGNEAVASPAGDVDIAPRRDAPASSQGADETTEAAE